ncbi:MAG TPA: archaemetzincin [Kofleriaceae bacterium]|nr:archaemetzincin [Kofleriaceae bacterium]
MPDVRTRVRAAGTLAGLSDSLRAAFAPATPDFSAILPPAPGDWLAEHVELGQTYDQYVASRPNRPDWRRRTLYIAPLGEPAGPGAPDLELVAAFARAHVGLPVRVLDPTPIEATGARGRQRGSLRQLLAPDLLAHLERSLPADAFALIGLTAADLYPDPGWNFVFGMASFRQRVGVYSVARYHPSFHGEADHDPAPDTWVLRRSLKVMAHEIGHMFGMEHCTYYECVMNGSNNLVETDRHPIHLCPVCLRKLHYAIGFDPVERYRRLARVFRRAGLGPEASWAAARAERVEAAARAERVEAAARAERVEAAARSTPRSP